MVDSIVKALKLAPRFLFAIWLTGAIILFAPGGFLTKAGLISVRQQQQSWIGIASLVAFVLWLTHAVLALWKWGRAKWLRRAWKLQAVKYLDTLSAEERQLLAYFVHRGAPTQALVLNIPPARSLCDKGLLSASSGSGNMFGWPYTIPEHVWEEINRRADELFPGIDTPEAKRLLDTYERRMHDLAMYGR